MLKIDTFAWLRQVTVDEIRGILKFKQVELKGQIQEVERRLARVKARLEQIEMEGTMPDFEVLRKTVPAQRIAFVREIISSWDQTIVGASPCQNVYGVGAYLGSHGVHAARTSDRVLSSPKPGYRWQN